MKLKLLSRSNMLLRLPCLESTTMKHPSSIVCTDMNITLDKTTSQNFVDILYFKDRISNEFTISYKPVNLDMENRTVIHQ